MKIVGKNGFLFAVFGFAVIVQTIFLSILPSRYHTNENTDYWTFYKPVGENILAGHGIVDNAGRLAATYPPGYPATVAAMFGLARVTGLRPTWAIGIVDVLLMSASCVLVFQVATFVFGVRVGFISSVLWITYPANLWLIKQPNSEVPFIFLFLGAVLIFCMALREQHYVLGFCCGAIVGLAALVRPIGLLIPVIFGAATVFYSTIAQKRRWALALLIISGFVLCVLPWETYVYLKNGAIIPLCTNGPASMSEGLVFGTEHIEGLKPMWLPTDLSILMERASGERSTMRTGGSILRFAIEEAKRNPLGAMELAVMKFYRPWYATYSRRYDTMNLAFQLFYVPLGLLGFILGIRWYKPQIYWIGLFISLVIYFWCMALLVIPLLRYMIPAMTFLIIAMSTLAEVFLPRGRSAISDTLPNPSAAR